MNLFGIYLDGSDPDFCINNTITSNTCNDNDWAGIRADYSNSNTFTSNTCIDSFAGISIQLSDNNTVTSNTCIDNQSAGINTYEADSNTVTSNTCNNNNNGIYMKTSNSNTLSSNTCNNNKGIYMDTSNSNTLSSNTCNDNYYGICMYSSNSNTLYLNRLNDNTSGNIGFYSACSNTWSSPTTLSYDFNGSSYTDYMGNYFDDYSGVDTTPADGIGDSDYPISGDANDDEYPLFLLVSPDSGGMGGGTSVTITSNSRTPLGNGSDINSVTLNGVAATITGQSATSVTVTSGAATAGTGEVVVNSPSLGITSKNIGYNYTAIGPLHHFDFTTISSPQVAGTPFSVTISAIDENDNPKTDYTGSPTLTDSTGSISPTSTGAFTSENWTGDITITKAQSGISITASDSGKTGSSNSFTVNPAALNYIVVSPDGDSITADDTKTFTSEAFDVYDNSRGDVTANTTFSISTGAGGSWADNVYTAETTGSWSVTGSYSGKSDGASLDVTPGALHHFTFDTISSPQVVGKPFSVTIASFDQYDNPKTDYTGSPTLTDSTGSISPTTTGAFTSENWTGDVTINTVQDNVTITTTDGAVSDSSNSFNVLPVPTEVWVDDDWASQTDVDTFNSALIWQYDAFNNIQDGVDAIHDSTVHVLDGTYDGGVTINVTGALIEGVYGAANTTISGSGGSGLSLTTDNITIRGFTIDGFYPSGITIASSANNCLVTDNIIKNNYDGILIDGDNNSITQNDIKNNMQLDSGIHIGNDTSGNTIYYNNITGNGYHFEFGSMPKGWVGSFGIYSESSSETNAELNWWGDASGPYNASANPDGMGDSSSDNVDFEPWLMAPWPDTNTGQTVTKQVSGTGTVSSSDTVTGIGIVSINGTGEHTITTATYDENPGGVFVYGTQDAFFDVHLDDEIGVTSLTVNFCPATAADCIYFWSGSDWLAASLQEYIAATGCIAVTITDETSPNLSDLSGLPFAQGSLVPVGGDAFSVNKLSILVAWLLELLGI